MKCSNDCFNCELPECIYDDPKRQEVHKFISGHCKGIGQRLKEAIKQRGMKQADLAERVGISAASITHYIHEDTIPRCEHLVIICEELGVSSDWLLGIKHKNKENKNDC